MKAFVVSLWVIGIALVIGCIGLLIQFTHQLHHGYLRTFLISFEVAVVIIVALLGVYAMFEES